jgi:hypothetical protein
MKNGLQNAAVLFLRVNDKEKRAHAAVALQEANMSRYEWHLAVSQ